MANNEQDKRPRAPKKANTDTVSFRVVASLQRGANDAVAVPHRGPIPVSYTHLDVYKRQLQRLHGVHIAIPALAHEVIAAGQARKALLAEGFALCHV